jgi:ribosome-binding factor A
MSIKIDRINKEMIREISNILENEIKDKSLRFVTITACHVTNDLSFAKVYFTCLNDSEIKLVESSLKQASGFIRKQLALRMNLRHTPELTFIYDESIEYGKKIENVIEKIHEGDKDE